MGEGKARMMIFDEEEVKPSIRKRKMEEAPKGMFEVPSEMTQSEWLKMNTMDFYILFHNIYCTALDDCTPSKCPKMRAGPKFEFLWAEGEYRTKPTHLPARDYIKRLVKWAQDLIDDPKVFPPKDAKGIENFIEVCARIWSRTIRIVMHIYCHHWQRMVDLEQDELVNEFTKHFMMFALKYKLISRAEYVSPIYDVLNKILPQNYKAMLKAIQGGADNGRSSKGGSRTTATSSSRKKEVLEVPVRVSSSPSITKTKGKREGEEGRLPSGRKEPSVLESALQARKMKEEAIKKQKEEEEKRKQEEELLLKRKQAEEEEERRIEQERQKAAREEQSESYDEEEDEEELLARLAEETGSIDISSLNGSQNNANSDIRLVLEMIRNEQARQEEQHSPKISERPKSPHSPTSTTKTTTSPLATIKPLSPKLASSQEREKIRRPIDMSRKMNNNNPAERKYATLNLKKVNASLNALGGSAAPSINRLPLGTSAATAKRAESLSLSPRGARGAGVADFQLKSVGTDTATSHQAPAPPSNEERNELLLLQQGQRNPDS